MTRSRLVLGAALTVVIAGAVLAAAALAAAGDTTLVSRASGAAGAKGNDTEGVGALSVTGRYVAFSSEATNLEPADTDHAEDVYLRDRVSNTTTLISRASGVAGAKQSGWPSSTDPDVSADGRYVAWFTPAGNLSAADTNDRDDVYVRDRQTSTTMLVSRASGANGAVGDWGASNAAMSADGRYIAFQTGATNLGDRDPHLHTNIYVRDIVANTTSLVSRATGVAGAPGNERSATPPAISANGRYVGFDSRATNFDPADTDSSIDDVYLRDLVSSTTTLVSRATGAAGAKGNAWSDIEAISADGRYVVFYSRATNLSPADTDSAGDIYVRDMVAKTTTLVSRASGAAGAKGNAESQLGDISDDGHLVSFHSTSTNLSPADADATTDVFVRDLTTNTTTVGSRSTTGAKANDYAGGGALSGDGRFLGFSSWATNLSPDDSDSTLDGFVRELGEPAPVPPPVEQVVVPDVREMSRNNATAAIRAKGLVAALNGPNSAAAWVYSQTPVGGTRVDPGSTVTLTLRTGPIP